MESLYKKAQAILCSKRLLPPVQVCNSYVWLTTNGNWLYRFEACIRTNKFLLAWSLVLNKYLDLCGIWRANQLYKLRSLCISKQASACLFFTCFLACAKFVLVGSPGPIRLLRWTAILNPMIRTRQRKIACAFAYKKLFKQINQLVKWPFYKPMSN